jgi:hypothetical protein
MNLTKESAELLFLAAKYYRCWDRSNPEVGMGPTDEMVLQSVVVEAGLNYQNLMAQNPQRVSDILDRLKRV